jgi:hypothetical protein
MRRVWLIVLALALGALPAGAQEGAGLIVQGATWHISAAPAALPAGPALYRAALPLITAPGAPAAVLFYGRTGDLRTGPGQVFAYGITALEYEVRVAGAQGLPYREEWSLDGQRQPQLDSAGTVPGSPATLTNALLFSAGGPLPRGSYRLRFLIAEFVAADTTVEIR